MICTPAEEIVKLHMIYRNSVNGRRKLGHLLMTQMDVIDDIELDDTIENRNVEILQAYFKVMGLKLAHGVEKMEIEINTDEIFDEFVGDKWVIGDLDDINEIKMRDMAKERLDEELFVGSKDDMKEELEKLYQEVKDEVDATSITID